MKIPMTCCANTYLEALNLMKIRLEKLVKAVELINNRLKSWIKLQVSSKDHGKVLKKAALNATL